MHVPLHNSATPPTPPSAPQVQGRSLDPSGNPGTLTAHEHLPTLIPSHLQDARHIKAEAGGCLRPPLGPPDVFGAVGASGASPGLPVGAAGTEEGIASAMAGALEQRDAGTAKALVYGTINALVGLPALVAFAALVFRVRVATQLQWS